MRQLTGPGDLLFELLLKGTSQAELGVAEREVNPDRLAAESELSPTWHVSSTALHLCSWRCDSLCPGLSTEPQTVAFSW